jgi:hypothetical protein
MKNIEVPNSTPAASQHVPCLNKVLEEGEVLKQDAFGNPVMIVLNHGCVVDVALSASDRRALLCLMKVFGLDLEVPDMPKGVLPTTKVMLWKCYGSDVLAETNLASLRAAFGPATKIAASSRPRRTKKKGKKEVSS